ncbi:MAG: class I SAM-dependent methyltransferase [Nitrospira sp.]|nr:MAG: class I SAM-dependent methyltransferase [Nitrospira sp.]
MLYVRSLCAREYRKQKYLGINERPIEFAFLFRQLAEFWPKTILDVGTGMTALPHLMRNCGFLVTATDNIKDYWPAGMTNRHYHVVNDDITRTALTETFDVITCISVLEHIHGHREAMISMYKLLKPGGRLILTCPYNENTYVSNVYKLPDSSVRDDFSFATQAFSRKELASWLSDSAFELLEQEYWQFFSGEFWTCGEKLSHPARVTRKDRHQLCCLSFVKPANKTRATSSPTQ